MALFTNQLGLYTDFYELAMAQGYFYCDKKDEPATFDYFFVAILLAVDLLFLPDYRIFWKCFPNFTIPNPIFEYLKEQGFKTEFLEYLKDFRFLREYFQCEGRRNYFSQRTDFAG